MGPAKFSGEISRENGRCRRGHFVIERLLPLLEDRHVGAANVVGFVVVHERKTAEIRHLPFLVDPMDLFAKDDGIGQHMGLVGDARLLALLLHVLGWVKEACLGLADGSDATPLPRHGCFYDGGMRVDGRNTFFSINSYVKIMAPTTKLAIFLINQSIENHQNCEGAIFRKPLLTQ